MAKVLIIGGGGMVGQKLAHRLADQGLEGHDALDVTLFDIGFPAQSAPGAQVTGNVTDQSKIDDLAATKFDIIFHLAAIVSGESETNFDLGWSVNMMSMWQFLEALRAQHTKSEGTYVPKLVFTSSIAVFGAPYPDKIGDEFLSAPQTSYGA